MRKTSANQLYDVPVVTSDLRHEELIHQIADSLDYLNNVMDDVFCRVQTRVSENKTRLAKITDRTRLAQAKVTHIRGRKKATQVFSVAKYPAPEKVEEYRSLFSEKTDHCEMKHSKFKLANKTQSHPTDQDMRDKHRFYSVKVSDKNRSDEDGEGLGRLPGNISSVSSLLLFNTAENPYKKYVMLDPRGMVTKMRAADDDEGAQGPAEAPTTIMLGEEIEPGQKESFGYRPDLGEVPLISLPDTLPDLADVAADLIYGADTGPSIAPSVFGTDNIPELPEIVLDQPPGVPDPTRSDTTPTQSNAPPPPPPPSNAPPPPPPPPPPPASAAPPPPPPPAAAPPPPPPPADAAGPPPPPPANVPAAVASDDGGGRSSLMEAIRNAGGAGTASLKKPSARKMEKKKEKETKAVASSGGDLMSDLAGMLKMRRQGIAGSGSAAAKSTSADEVPKPPPPTSEGSGDVMSKMSELIPYTPAAADDDDDDWD